MKWPTRPSLPYSFVKEYQNKPTPFATLGYIVYKRTYARRIGINDTEEWWETCRRVTDGILDLGIKLTEEEVKKYYDMLFNLHGSPAGRGLWQLGTSTVENLGGASLNNCWGVVCDHPKVFAFIMDNLMLGGGVGANVMREYVYNLPAVKPRVYVTRKDSNDADFIVPDSRDGWVRLLDKVIKAYFYSGKSFTYSTVCLRSAGAQIKTFGGVSAGPEAFCDGISQICDIFRSRAGRKLRPIDCLDLIAVIATIVKSGNVRRSATLIIGDPDDKDFVSAKCWGKGNVPDYRRACNISVACDNLDQLIPEYWENYEVDPKTGFGVGECPGLINFKLARSMGRLIDAPQADDVNVFNPCAEIGLASPPETGQGEACNLFGINGPLIHSLGDAVETALFGYRTTKTIGSMDYHWPKTNEQIHKNMRLGLSMGGICQMYKRLGEKDLIVWLDTIYQAIKEEDRNYSKEMGFPTSIKLTCGKPDGTASLLAGITPGVHPAEAEFIIRRLRMASANSLLTLLQQAGYHIEPELRMDGTPDYTTSVIDFPIHMKNAIYADEMTAIQQLQMVKLVNTWWSDNSTSVTIYYTPQELPTIKEWLRDNYETSLKAVSFLLKSIHGFKQAPLEAITKEQFEAMSKALKPIVHKTRDITDEVENNTECAGGACPIK